jgi:glutaredoxin/glutathione-dependent peroxiredoxin
MARALANRNSQSKYKDVFICVAPRKALRSRVIDFACVSDAKVATGIGSQRRIVVTIAVGDTLPAATLVKVTEAGPESVDAASYFAGKRVALFSVPGAFTPTCSARHLPGFVEKAAELKAKGIDEIAATAVNDAFVMSAWAKAGGAEGITMLADGNGAFAKALGLTMDSSKFGMGTRGQRFAMIINDGRVEQLHVEAPGEFRVSSAEYLLEQL